MSKWEWHRNGARKWVIYNDGRTSPTLGQDNLIFKSDNWGGDVTMALAANASVKFYGSVTASTHISSSGTGSFQHLRVNYDDMQTSDPGIKGVVWRSGTDLKISAG